MPGVPRRQENAICDDGKNIDYDVASETIIHKANIKQCIETAAR